MKFVLIAGAAIALILGLLFTLRSSRNAGMPSEEVLKRAAKRSRDQADSGDDE
jgi:hypothetical protein